MSDLLVTLAFIGFLAFGLISPFFLSLGYVWVDTFYPQFVARGMLGSVPVSFIMGAAAVGSYLLMDRRSPPRLGLLFALYLALAAWITLTTTWAVLPGPAWSKWDVSFKTLAFAAFIPFVIRSRIQIEAFVQVLLFSTAAHLLPWGAKTLLTGGGYNQSLGLLDSNQMPLSESSVVSAVSIMFVPLLVVLARHNRLIPPGRLPRLLFYGLIASFLIGSVGTFARTGLIGLAVMGGGMLWRSKRKAGFAVAGAVALGLMFAVTSDKWTERVSTISDYQTEGSALVRTLVWQWTWDFAKEHPLGGGFEVYMTNRIVLPVTDPDGEAIVQNGRAFHNIFFAVLGEHGYPGLALYLSIMGVSLLGLQTTRRTLRGLPEHAWCYEMAGALQISLATLLTCANFVDISFNGLLWEMLALSVCLREYARRVVREDKVPLAHRDSAMRRPQTA
jgi:putative inorganic carbon (HCO3(-)) transporter